MKTLQTPYCTLQLENEVMVVTMNPGMEVSLEIMEHSVLAAVKFADEKPYYCIIDLRAGVTDTSESREYFANNPNNKYRIADAILLDSLPVRLIANFYIKINKPTVPTRLFNSLADAFTWVNKLKIEKSK